MSTPSSASKFSPSLSPPSSCTSAALTTSIARIDGSKGEGGGQILRNSVTYASLMNSASVEIVNVRAGRSKPGLRPQHRTALRLCADVCGGTLEGDEVGSSTVRYAPASAGGENRHAREAGKRGGQRTIKGDTGTAGSVVLLLQSSLPCALFAPHRPMTLELLGGTNASHAPPIDYFTLVFLPTIESNFGIPPVEIEVERRGYFPRGGGIVKATVSHPVKGTLKPMVCKERGEVVDVYVRSYHAGKVPRYVAIEMAKSALKMLRSASVHDGSDDQKGSDGFLLPRGVEPRVEIVTEKSAIGNGSGLILVAKTNTNCMIAGSALGGPKIRPKDTGTQAALELIEGLRSGGCVDQWMQDQLILYMSLAEGISEVVTGSLTLHTQTAIMVSEKLTGASFEVTRLDCEKVGGEGDKRSEGHGAENGRMDDGDCEYGKNGMVDGRHLIRCHGIGFCP